MPFFKSTISQKVIVALTGLVLFGFIVGHLLGNLQIYLGKEGLNDYAEFLDQSPKLVWGTRIILITSVILHIFYTISLTIQNRRSRPIAYEAYQPKSSTLASRTMIWGGITIFLYIIFHLLHLTTGHLHPHYIEEDVYANVVTGLSVWYVALFYIFANTALGLHLYHGLWSLFQTLGINHPKYNSARRTGATIFSFCIAGGYISIPVAILAGVVK